MGPFRRRRGIVKLEPGAEPAALTPDDGPEAHETVGQHFLPNVSDLAPALKAAAETNAATVAAPGFVPIDISSDVEVVRDVCTKRSTMAPGDEPVVLLYRPQRGDFLCSLAGADHLWLAQDRGGVDLTRVLHITLEPLPRPQYKGGGSMERPGLAELRRQALDDCYRVGLWHWDPNDGRCWYPGTAVPPAAVDGPSVALSARAIRVIVRAVEARFTDWPRHPDAAYMVFDPPTGEYMGSIVWPPRAERPAETWLRLLPQLDDDDPEVLRERLARVRIRPSGVVEMVPS